MHMYSTAPTCLGEGGMSTGLGLCLEELSGAFPKILSRWFTHGIFFRGGSDTASQPTNHMQTESLTDSTCGMHNAFFAYIWSIMHTLT